MGYTANYFDVHVKNWLKNGWLNISDRIIEFGAQEFYGHEEEAKKQVRNFLRRRGVIKTQIDAVTDANNRLSVRAIYTALGIDYTAIDVDGANGSKFFDLNSYAPEADWRGTFDFVNDEGTIEHLVNPINGFQVAHELLKVGGVARHSVPLTGWLHHGFVYPSAKFYAKLIGQNGYELLEAKVQLGTGTADLGDPRFKLVDESGRPLPSDSGMVDSWIWLIYRKQSDAAFKIPVDHIYSDIPDIDKEREAVEERLIENFARYSHRRIGEDVDEVAPGDAIERQLELQSR